MNKLPRYCIAEDMAGHWRDMKRGEWYKVSDVSPLEAELATARTGLIGAHVAISELTAENERLFKYIKAGGHLEGCYADEFTRTVDCEGNAETYSCTCGLEAILNREQEKQP